MIKRIIKNKKVLYGIGTALAVMIALLVIKSSGSKNDSGQGGFAMQVVVVAAQQETIEETIPLVGTLAANESVEIKSEAEGKIEAINFKEGQYVNKGYVLFLINQAKLVAQVKQAEANYKLSQSNMLRSQSLVENGTISKQEYDQALSKYESDKANLELMNQELQDATITAPFGGRTGARLVSPGQVITKGTLLSTLIDSHPMKVEFNVPERYAGRLRTRLAIEIKVESYPDEVFGGKVYFISPFVDTQTRTILVKAKIPNKEGRLQPGMFANLDLHLGTLENAITIPGAALMKQGEQDQVYVATPEKKADLRIVKIGLRLKGKVQILEGIQLNDFVVTEGIQKIRPGVPLSFEAPVSTRPASNLESPPASAKDTTPTAKTN